MLNSIPVNSTPTPTNIVRDIAWIRGHVIALAIALAVIAGSILGGVSLTEGFIERHDARVAAATQKAEGVDTSAQAALLSQLQQEHAENEARDAQQVALIQTLIQQMQAERAATAKQVTVDRSLDAADSAARLVQQTNSPPSAVSVAGDAVTMTLPLTRTVISDLDELTQSQKDVTNLTAQLDAQQTLTNDAKSEVSTANQVIAADKTELIATIKADVAACDVRVNKQAAKDRKRGLVMSVLSAIGALAARAAL
jgi:adenine-specific DNA methylase